MKHKVIVIGAGPAGCLAASYLQRKGVEVLVIEKESFPRFVIGESLLPATMSHLEEAGLLEHIIDMPFQKKYGARFIDDESTCTFTFDEQYTPSYGWTWQVQRADFDLALVEAARKNGVQFRFNTTVTKFDNANPENPVVHILTKHGEESQLAGDYVIDASGYGRVLPRLLDLNNPSEMPERGAVFTHVRDSKRSAFDESRITIYNLSNDAWLWHIPFADGTTSVGMVGEKQDIESYAANGGERFKNFVQDYEPLKNRYNSDSFVFEPKSNLGYSIGVKQMFGPGYVLCGNSTEFLDPIFSSGVALATASGLQAAKLIVRQLLGEKVDWQRDYEDYMKQGLSVFKTYVSTWYTGELKTIFFSSQIAPEIKKQICSVLAGHVWDVTNPFVKNHSRLVATLAKVITIENQKPLA